MKFKYLVIIFNIIIVFFLSIVAVFPLFFMGSDFSAVFWRSAWPLALVLILALVFLNVFFALNYRLYKLLEREDWPALVDYLEEKVMGKGHYSPRLVRLLANSYLVMSDSPAVLRLEGKALVAKPALIESNALIFGAARILGGDPQDAAKFFELHLERAKSGSAEAQWMHWYLGFSQTLAGMFEQGEETFKAIAANSGDAILAALAAYFLETAMAKRSADPEACERLAGQARERVKATIKSQALWKKEAARVETEVHAAIIKKYIDEVETWLYSA